MSALHRQDIPVETLATCARGPCAGAAGAGGLFPTLNAAEQAFFTALETADVHAQPMRDIS
jgi:hypothetical protein